MRQTKKAVKKKAPTKKAAPKKAAKSARPVVDVTRLTSPKPAVQDAVVSCEHRWLERWQEKANGQVIRLSGSVCIKCGAQQVPIAGRGVVVSKEKTS